MYNQKKSNKQQKKFNILAIVITLLIAVIVGSVVVNKIVNTNVIKDGASASKSVNKQGNTVLSDDGDLIIPIKDISSTAIFYPVEVDGTKLEVLAVEALDGTIRTAFNTCQVCYSSGRGYYEQRGDVLVCQNCGNRFKTSDVEVTRGGCNPVPIFSDEKMVDDENIKISKQFLTESKDIFSNWKIE